MGVGANYQNISIILNLECCQMKINTNIIKRYFILFCNQLSFTEHIFVKQIMPSGQINFVGIIKKIVYRIKKNQGVFTPLSLYHQTKHCKDLFLPLLFFQNTGRDTFVGESEKCVKGLQKCTCNQAYRESSVNKTIHIKIIKPIFFLSYFIKRVISSFFVKFYISKGDQQFLC